MSTHLEQGDKFFQQNSGTHEEVLVRYELRGPLSGDFLEGEAGGVAPHPHYREL